MNVRAMTSPVTSSNGAGAERSSPYAALAAKARATSDGVLAAEVGGAALYLALLLLFRPAWWAFVIAPLAVGAFGLWGIAEREAGASNSPARQRLLHATQLVAVVVGTLAVLLTAFRVLGALVGTVIS